MRCRDRPARAAGFAVPLAVVLLIALALLATLLIEASLGEFRTSSASLREARAAAVAESTMASLLLLRFDTAAHRVAAGTVAFRQTVVTGDSVTGDSVTGDSVTAMVQVLAPGLVRVTAMVALRQGRLRAIAGRLGYARLVRDSPSAAELSLAPLSAHWWAAIP